MREIKFRAWDRIRNNWIDEIINANQSLHWDFDNNLLTVVENNEPNFIYHFNSIIIIQFTGLKDKNGKEIYEGDILKITRINWYCPSHPKHNTDLIDQVEVYWDEEKNGMFTRTFDFERLKSNPNQRPYSSSGFLGDGWNDERADNNIWEVIGNIYKNPELLN